ncbi:MAG TPA: poly-beta-1,6 N-acetyl-D-glucosamine synthase [Lentisphaeria bacterium]|nr:MAG: poly-beta-1,6 N-acetyl-D-glucosamine synthase [Lentisphaerae bacterium GWF2_50_93]HCE46882.1 poly-beta-1,6 N-acetyl-D-glucosamine synthase [Lentisphaeria bacterium]
MMEYIYNFVFYYPLLMGFIWMFGSILFRLYRDRYVLKEPEIPENPMVSILVPCHNEEECIEDTIRYLQLQTYRNFEIIAIDDASRDRTGGILRDLQKEFSNLRVITLKSNQGKGTGLTMAAMASNGEFLVGIDADALLDPGAIKWILWHFVNFPRVGAVTGNPKVRNRTTLLAKIQVGEYSTIIGMIKRTQRILGKIYTVSGVVAAFRKKALLDVGWWSNNMVTEDIDVSWKLQLDKWDIRYEANALCWILVPETLKGIFKQRLRWSQGGNEVLIKYFTEMLSWKNRRIWPLYIEYATSVLWCYLLLLTFLLWFLHCLGVPLPHNLVVRSILPGWTGVMLAGVCMLQLTVGIMFDARYDRTLIKLIPWMIWYPAIYWVITWMTTIIAFPKALLKKKDTLAVWESPDRGIS